MTRWIAAALAVLAATGCVPRGAPKQEQAEATASAAISEQALKKEISCKADRRLECSGAGCESVADDFLQVQLTYAPHEERGELCTFTYCRGVALVPTPGGDALSGLVLSAASGSTEPASKRPTIDYVLTVAPDLRTFVLAGVGGGRLSGYGGACVPVEPRPPQ
jgi:hypothetical protein